MIKRFILICVLLFISQSLFADAFIALADIHFDPFVGCNKAVPCELFSALQRAPVSSWDNIFTQYDKSTPKHYVDTDYRLLNSSLQAAGKIAQDYHAQFVLVLGDELGHNLRRSYKHYTGDKTHAGYEAFVRKLLQFIALKMNQAFPNVSVFSVLGNNDSYYGDYVTVPQSVFLKDIGQVWAGLIRQDASLRASVQHQLSIDGYYAVTMPSLPELKLIALNTNLFSTYTKSKDKEDSAQAQLRWLHQELQQAAAKHQKVIIAMHIPMNIEIYANLRTRLMRLASLWRSGIAEKFEKELAEHATIITGIITGHLHSDWLHIKAFPDDVQIPMIGVSSVSPIFGNSPSFKVVFFSAKTLALQNYIIYSNSFTRTDEWKKEYDFNDSYQRDCTDCEIIKVR